MPSPDWRIPPKLQPEPGDYGYDLDRALKAMVGLKATVPDDAFTAGALGTERIGSGAVIRADGLVLTIGYLITEAEQIWLTDCEGHVLPGHALAYDQATGFGLVQPLGRLAVPHLGLGNPGAVAIGDALVMAAAGGRTHAIEAKLVGRQQFAGYWEYLLEDALFTAPAHPFWSGAALLDGRGELIGVGSLILQQGDGGRRLDTNMVVPVHHLRPILQDLLRYGRVDRPPRPWLGLYAVEDEDEILIGGCSSNGPAEQAGLRKGDRVLAVNDEPVPDLAGLWTRLWSSGAAGVCITLRISRDGRSMVVPLVTADRAAFLKPPRLH
ncbi:MAG TPA: S1C family serine protease [Acetobacteraceae bacterium]|nr:S1C family serine protease [Acetobacteraceae bacterium]